MWQFLLLLSKRYREFFFLFFLVIVFFVVYLFLYLRPSVLELSPLSVLSCGSSRLFGSFVERGTVSTLADIDINCGGLDPVELKEKKVPAFLILNQPDESINYFFIRQLVFYNQFSVTENLSSLALNQVHPRSTTVINQNIVPIGFPGFIVLMAGIIKIFTFVFSQNFFNFFAVLIMPLIGALTPILGYYVWRNFWSKQVAMTAAILLFILPAWWYNSSRPFQHNLFFVFLLFVALSFFLSSLTVLAKKKILKVFFSGFFWALALYVRPSEFWWMLALGIFGLVQVKKVWNKKEFIAVICGVLLVGVGFFATQYAFYGNIFGSGYVIPQSSGEAGVVFSGPQGINFWQAIILPFGFHPLTAIKTFVKYFFVLFRPWLWLSFAGFSLLFFNRFKSKQTGEEVGVNNFKYVAVWFLLSLYILIFYGSWEFFDNLAMTPSIGTSYVRYFLPIYVFSLPLAAYFLVKLWFLNKVVSKFLVILLALLLLGASFGEVYLKLDGLQQVKINVKQYQEWQEKIYQLTEPESVIVTRYADKYLFPGRKVISGWQNDEQVTAIINLVKDGDHVYFYDLKLDPATEDSFRQKLLLGGVDLKEVVASWDDLELRKIGPR